MLRKRPGVTIGIFFTTGLCAAYCSTPNEKKKTKHSNNTTWRTDMFVQPSMTISELAEAWVRANSISICRGNNVPLSYNQC